MTKLSPAPAGRLGCRRIGKLRWTALAWLVATLGACAPPYVYSPPVYGAPAHGCVWVPGHHRPLYGWVPGHWRC